VIQSCVSADVADLRTALGIDKWNVYRVSYGTNLALPLLRDDPEGIRAMVLDGGVPPADPIGGSGRRRRAAGYQALFYACARDPKCHRTCPTSSTVTFDSQVNRGDA